MNKSQTIEGVWWIHGRDKPSHIGTLTFDPEKGFELNVKIPQSRTSDEAFLAMLDMDKEEVASVIQGTNVNANPVTLFGCAIQKISKGAGMDNYRVHVSAAILNHHVATWESAQYPAAGVKFNLLTKWLNQNFEIYDEQRVKEAIKRKSILFEFQLHDELEFIISPEIRIKIQSFPHPSHASAELTIKQVHTLYFLFANPMPAQKIFDEYVTVFLRLLSMLTGERVFVEKISPHNHDPFDFKGSERLVSYELLLQNPGVGEAKTDVHAGHMIASYKEVASNFQDILKKWYDCHQRLKPVLDLYFAVLSMALTDESRFLFLAQALEVYHARSTLFSSTETTEEKHQQRLEDILKCAPTEKDRKWMERKLRFSNQKSLGNRIDELLKHHSKEASHLTAKIGDFAAKVLASRNYYTHYSKKTLQDGKVAKRLELRRIAYALLYLLQICLLKELGVDGKPIERILKRNSDVKWPDLEKKVEAVKIVNI